MFGSILVLASSVARAASKYHLLLRDPHFSVIAVLVYRRPTIERRNVESVVTRETRVGRSRSSRYAGRIRKREKKKEYLRRDATICVRVIRVTISKIDAFSRGLDRRKKRTRVSIATTLLHINGGGSKPCDRLGAPYVVPQKSFDRVPKILD